MAVMAKRAVQETGGTGQVQWPPVVLTHSAAADVAFRPCRDLSRERVRSFEWARALALVKRPE